MKMTEQRLRKIIRDVLESNYATSKKVRITESSIRTIVSKLLSEIDIDYGRMQQQDKFLQTKKDISTAKGPKTQTREEKAAEQELSKAMEATNDIIRSLSAKRYDALKQVIPILQNSLQNLFMSSSSSKSSDEITKLVKIFRQFNEALKGTDYKSATSFAKMLYSAMQDMGSLTGNPYTSKNISRN